MFCIQEIYSIFIEEIIFLESSDRNILKTDLRRSVWAPEPTSTSS